LCLDALDVARTAYRLWELEAAKPQPDRWRLISRWLGVSVTTMLLADGLDAETDVDRVSAEFERVGGTWEFELTDPRAFFTSARTLIQKGTEKGFVSTAHAEELLEVLERVEHERLQQVVTEAWEPAKLHKVLRAEDAAPKAAREAVAFVAADLPDPLVRTAQLLASELVTNSVRHGPADSPIGLAIEIERDRLRIEVADNATGAPQITEPSPEGGYGLALIDKLADRWETERGRTGNRTWLELGITQPGAKPERR
jgi:anti-sigma regulatory factor (Ser/Thr protein kinase)